MSTTTNPDPSPGSLAFVPLEANPELMTSLLHKLGLSQALQIHDVYSITEPELLAFVPRPALALLLVFPVSATYESHRLAEDAGVPEYTGSGDDEPVIWYKQTIRNACGLMGLLHAVSNGPARGFVGKSPSSLPLSTSSFFFRTQHTPPPPPNRLHPAAPRPALRPSRTHPRARRRAPRSREPRRDGSARRARRRGPALRVLREDGGRHAVGARRPAQGPYRPRQAGRRRGRLVRQGAAVGPAAVPRARRWRYAL
ncbi:cysteine proteinase [Daldinia grandis]|nr:cysteine proteinase [Daldinia grandis]